MNVGLRGENLIFLISQPRAGSTLLQRMLASHPEIHSVSEPWLSLHPFYALRARGYEAEYDAFRAQQALKSFIGTLPSGEDDYLEGVRRMYAYLYGRAAESSGKKFFLDKTPRYYLIISDLYRAFPNARFIVLLRHPIAVLCSMFNTWAKHDWSSFYTLRHDLVSAPRLLVEGINLLDKAGIVVRYEQLVVQPDNEAKRLCKQLGIEFVPDIVEYNQHQDLQRWDLGDQETIYKHTRPAPQNADRWLGDLAVPQVWRLASDYLHRLGRETMEQMGYSYHETLQILNDYRPPLMQRWLTLSLDLMLQKRAGFLKKWGRRVSILNEASRRGGMRVATNMLVRKLRAGFSPDVGQNESIME